MTFSQKNTDLLIPDALPPAQALARTTHMGIGAHQDDLEFMALHGILKCFQRDDRWFGGVTCTDGAGSSRTGPYRDFSDLQMQAVRTKEQKSAARIGQYSFMVQLGHPSANAKDPARRAPMVDDLVAVLEAARPEIVYTHNPFDKHATHVGVLQAVIAAIRRLPAEHRPAKLYGCEVWRGLDWLPDDLKVVHDVSAHPNLAAAMNGVFDSQIAGGKRYDLAVEGRRCANATFLESQAVDAATWCSYAVDLTALIRDDGPSLTVFVEETLATFSDAVRAGL